MAVSGKEYAQRVRELRAAGREFAPSAGYRLADAAHWSSGQKAAVTRAWNRIDDVVATEDGDTFVDHERVELYYEDAAGDESEEWDDIYYFDFDEADDFGDDEADGYTGD